MSPNEPLYVSLRSRLGDICHTSRDGRTSFCGVTLPASALRPDWPELVTCEACVDRRPAYGYSRHHTAENYSLVPMRDNSGAIIEQDNPHHLRSNTVVTDGEHFGVVSVDSRGRLVVCAASTTVRKSTSTVEDDLTRWRPALALADLPEVHGEQISRSRWSKAFDEARDILSDEYAAQPYDSFDLCSAAVLYALRTPIEDRYNVDYATPPVGARIMMGGIEGVVREDRVVFEDGSEQPRIALYSNVFTLISES